ncbi:MAG: cyclic nucleotide-binding domain-containing protein [Acidobacteriota bacterium]
MLSWFRGRRGGGHDDDDPEHLLARGDVDQALAVIENLLAEDPENEPLRRALAEALHRTGDRQKAVGVLFDLANELAHDGHVTRSFAVLKQAEQLDPSPEASDRAVEMMKAANQAASITFTTSEIVLEDWLAKAEEREDFLGSPFFADLSERELGLLFDELRLRLKHPGALIYAAGEPAGGLFVLASGAVRVYEPDDQERHHQVALLREGDVFGVGGVLGLGRRTHTVTAAGQCEILEIDRALFDRLAGRHPMLRARVEAIAAERAKAEPGSDDEPA